MREWLKDLPKNERRIIGEDIMTVQFRWPLGMPLVDNLGSGIWEIRSKLPTSDRTNFYFSVHPRRNRSAPRIHQENAKNSTGGQSFSSATQKCLHQKQLKLRNKHRGSSFEDFLKQEGLLENVQAAAFKRALAMKVNDMMKENA